MPAGPHQWVDGPPGDYSAPTQNAAIGTATEEVVAANVKRICVIISNYGTVDVYLAAGNSAEINKGIFLRASTGVAQFGGPAGLPLTTEAINGIVVSGSGTVAIQEVEGA